LRGELRGRDRAQGARDALGDPHGPSGAFFERNHRRNSARHDTALADGTGAPASAAAICFKKRSTLSMPFIAFLRIRVP